VVVSADKLLGYMSFHPLYIQLDKVHNGSRVVQPLHNMSLQDSRDPEKEFIIAEVKP
jgi:hypothetical protein